MQKTKKTMSVRVGDRVRVAVGADRGKEGKVTQAFTRQGLLVVEGVRRRIKHLRARGDQPGRRVEFFGPIPRANVRLLGTSGTPGRVGWRWLEKDGKRVKVRVVRRRGHEEELISSTS